MQYLGTISKTIRIILVHFQGKPFSITVIKIYAPITKQKKLKLTSSIKTYKDTQKICLFHHRGLECKSRKSRDTWNSGQFGLGVQNELVKRTCWLQQTPFSNNPREDATHGHQNMVKTEIRLIMLAAKDGEAPYSQQKQDLEPTLAQIMNSLLQNSDLN